MSYLFFRDSIYERSIRKLESGARETTRILYASRGGFSKQIGNIISEGLNTSSTESLLDFNFDDIFNLKQLVLVVGSDAGGLPVPDGLLFFKLLEDAAQDFRVSRDILSVLKVSVVGVGSIEYGIDNFCMTLRRLLC